MQDHNMDLRDMVIEHQTKLKQLMGNGQPGLIKNVQDDIEELKSLKWKLIGAGVALITIMEILHTGLEKVVSNVLK